MRGADCGVAGLRLDAPEQRSARSDAPLGLRDARLVRTGEPDRRTGASAAPAAARRHHADRHVERIASSAINARRRHH